MKDKTVPSDVFCPHKDCPDYGKNIPENFYVRNFYGKEQRKLLRCKTCKRTFSENSGTMFFGLKSDKKTILNALAMLAEKGSIRGVERVTGIHRDIISDWIKRAGEHCEAVSNMLIKDLNLDQVQVDEIWTYVKKKTKIALKKNVKIT